MAINNYTTWVDLACASTAGIVVDDIVTGADSSAVGLVYSVTDNTKFTVVMISGTFDDSGSGGEVISNQDSDTCTITDRVATTETTPTNAVIVTGDNTGSTDIFRDIRNASNTGGWGLHTDPSATDYNLYLDAIIYIGRRDDASQTSCISENEVVDLLTDDTLNAIRIVGNSTYNGTLRVGNAKYVSDSESNFPPRRFWNGCRLKASVYINTNGILKIYDSSIYGDGTNGGLFAYTDATVLIAGLVMRDGTYSSFASDSMKITDLTMTNKSFVLAAAGIEWYRNVVMAPGDWTIFLAGLSAEGIIEDTELLGDDDLPAGNYGGFGANMIIHARNCSIKTNIAIALAATLWIIDEKSFDVNVIDYNNNAIEDAKIYLYDKDGYSILFNDSGETVSSAITNVATSLSVTDYTQFSSGDIIRIDTERLLVTNASSNPLTVTRAYQGSAATAHAAGRIIWNVEKYIETDSNGDCPTRYVPIYHMYQTSVTRVYTPFTMYVSKQGFETEYKKFVLGDGTNTSYKCDIINEKIKLRNSLSQGRDSMADAFK